VASRRAAIVGLISVVAVAVIAIVAVVGPPALFELNKAHDYADETSALKSIQTLNTAQVQYNSMYGRYAGSLAELGPSASNLIPADLATGEKEGYNLR
jgi:hypothetical protein